MPAQTNAGTPAQVKQKWAEGSSGARPWRYNSRALLLLCVIFANSILAVAALKLEFQKIDTTAAAQRRNGVQVSHMLEILLVITPFIM